MAQPGEHVEEWTLLGSEKPELITARSESDLSSSSDEAPSAALGVSVYFSNVEENLELLKGEQLDSKYAKFMPVAENSSKMSGTLYLTNYQLIYKARSLEDGTQEDLKIPIGLIDRVDLNIDGSVLLSTKHLMVLNLTFPSPELTHAFVKRLGELMSYPPPQRFAFYNLEDVSTLSQKDGWDVYDIRHEYFDRQGVDPNKWRITDVNKDFLICKSYPPLFAVPAPITDEVLTRAAKFRAAGRLPALCWYNPRTRASICRSSQPMVGLVGNRNQDDEELIRAIAATNPLRNPIYIVDCRPWSSALANRAKGAGVESVENYAHSRVVFMNVDNIHTMRDSLKTVFDLLRTGKGDNRWLSSLDSTRWLEHLRLVLSGGARIARMLEMERCSVLVHCSDGWDRTAQLSCLAQLLLDPYYRTLRGFQVLLEKEWLSFGHKFADRCGHGKGMFQDTECSPVFLQFIDCVWQISNQFQCAFQFNEHFLIFLLDNLYSCRFGTFLCNTELERLKHKVRTRSVSLWSYVNAKAPQFVNPIYKAHEGALFPVCTPQYISFWSSYYLRFHHKTAQIREDEQEREALRTQLASRNGKLEAEVSKLKKMLEKEARRMRELELELGRANKEKDLLKKAVNCTIYKGDAVGDPAAASAPAEPQVLMKMRSSVSDADLLQRFTTDLKNLQVIEDYQPNMDAAASVSPALPVAPVVDDEFVVVGEEQKPLGQHGDSSSCRVDDHVMLEISESSGDGAEGNTVVRFPVRLNDYLRTLTHYMRQYGNGFLPSFLVQPTASS